MIKSNNQSNFYLLRVISILFVLSLHYLNGDSGGFINNVDIIGINKLIVHIIESVCIVGVNVFIITSGYFLIEKNIIKLRKVVDILTVLVFYSLIIFIGVIWLGTFDFSVEIFKKFVLSITDRWFVTIYIILYLMHPYLNKLLNNLNKNTFLMLIIIFILFFSLWPSFLTDVTIKDGGYGIINFSLLYMIGAFLRKYGCTFSFKSILILYILSTIFIILFSFYTARAWNYNFIFVIVASVALFILFSKLEINNNVIINEVAQYSLGIYIIHGNPFIIKFIFQNIYQTPSYFSSDFMLIHLFFTIITLYIACVFIDFVRKIIFKYTVDKLYDKVELINMKVEI